MVRKGNLDVFESSNIFETRKVTPTKIGVHACYMMYMYVTSMPTCMNFLSRFRLIKFFDDHGL